jgi:hypothetical protein
MKTAFIAQPVPVAKFNEPDPAARFYYFPYIIKNCWFGSSSPVQRFTKLSLQYRSGNEHCQTKFV